MSDTKLSKSLSYKMLAGVGNLLDEEVKAHFKELAKEDTVIAQVAGEISGFSSKTGQYGENIAFSGEFIAKSAITGDIMETTKMFFDKGFSEILKGQFQNRGDGNSMVKFSAQISVVKYHKAPGYTFMATPLRTPEAISRRAELLGVLASAPLQIAAKPAAKK